MMTETMKWKVRLMVSGTAIFFAFGMLCRVFA